MSPCEQSFLTDLQSECLAKLGAPLCMKGDRMDCDAKAQQYYEEIVEFREQMKIEE